MSARRLLIWSWIIQQLDHPGTSALRRTRQKQRPTQTDGWDLGRGATPPADTGTEDEAVQKRAEFPALNFPGDCSSLRKRSLQSFQGVCLPPSSASEKGPKLIGSSHDRTSNPASNGIDIILPGRESSLNFYIKIQTIPFGEPFGSLSHAE